MKELGRLLVELEEKIKNQIFKYNEVLLLLEEERSRLFLINENMRILKEELSLKDFLLREKQEELNFAQMMIEEITNNLDKNKSLFEEKIVASKQINEIIKDNRFELVVGSFENKDDEKIL